MEGYENERVEHEEDILSLLDELEANLKRLSSQNIDENPFATNTQFSEHHEPAPAWGQNIPRPLHPTEKAVAVAGPVPGPIPGPNVPPYSYPTEKAVAAEPVPAPMPEPNVPPYFYPAGKAAAAEPVPGPIPGPNVPPYFYPTGKAAAAGPVPAPMPEPNVPPYFYPAEQATTIAKREPLPEVVVVKAKKKKSSVLSNILFYAAMVALIGGATLFSLSDNPEKSIFGYRFYNVETGSMTPGEYSMSHGFTDGFYAGDMIIVKLCKPEEVSKNDIITFVPGWNSNTYLTHRVVDIKTELGGQQGVFFVTKGDSNNAEDPPIPSEMLIGKKVLNIPKVGAAIKYIQENLVISLIIIFSTFLLICTLYQFFKKTPPDENPTPAKSPVKIPAGRQRYKYL